MESRDDSLLRERLAALQRGDLLGADAAIDLLQFLESHDFIVELGGHFFAGAGDEAARPTVREGLGVGNQVWKQFLA